MRLTKHSDYALRILIYAATHPDRLVSTDEIATAYGISGHHVAKIVTSLRDLEYIEVKRGRTGGLRLARPPAAIGIGEVVRHTEPDFFLVECFDHDRDACPLTRGCALIAPLRDALAAFLEVLDRFTLADVTAPQQRAKYRRLLAILD